MSSLYFRFKARGDGSADSPLLSRLLARADSLSVVTDWRADALRATAPSATAPGAAAPGAVAPALDAAAPLALFAAQGMVHGAWACFATPVHYTAEMSNVRLRQDGILRLSVSEATALAADFNRVWHDAGVSMMVGRFADLFCIFDESLQVTTRDPEQVLGHTIEAFLPTGPNAAHLRRLMSETEMWLFERRSPALLNGLWLWGGGAMRRLSDYTNLKTAGEDALFNYFHGDVSKGGIVCAPEPHSAEWSTAQSRWLEPAVAALKSGQIDHLLLSAADRCFKLKAAHLWRFWRSNRAWSENFQ